MMRGGHAYIVGVVSRGEICAHHNMPGIYTEVIKFRDWIRKNSKDGDCLKGRSTLRRKSPRRKKRKRRRSFR